MSQGSPLSTLADAAATLLKPLAALGSILGRSPARLWRLAWLRSRADGTVPASTQFDGPVHTAGRVRLRFGEHCRLGRGTFFDPSVIDPLQVLVPVKLYKVPVLLGPVAPRVNVSGMLSAPPSTLRTAPPRIIVSLPGPSSPSPVLFCTRTVPPVAMTWPSKVLGLVPASTSVPEPLLKRPLGPSR